MYNYKDFSISDEEDFITIFLFENDFNISKHKIVNFDLTNPNYISFRRKIIADNLLNPSNEWQLKLDKRIIKMLNQRKIDEIIKKNKKEIEKEIIIKYKIGDYITYKGHKGEITKINYLKNKYKNYDIKIGKKEIFDIDYSDLQLRENLKKKYKKIPDNPVYIKKNTKWLLNKLKRERMSYYYGKMTELEFLQLKKELSERPHILKKDKSLNK